MLLFGEVRLIGVEVRPPVGVEIVRWEGTQDEFARFIALPYSTRDDSRLGPSAMTATDGLGRYRFFRPVRKGPTYAVRVVPLIHEPFGVTYYPQLLGPHTPDTLELVLELRPRGND